jgi:hypothetical protein
VTARWLRAPALHFVALGGLLFLARSRADAPVVADPVVVTADDVRRLQADFAEQRGVPPTIAETRGLVAQAVDDALLEREARALGLLGQDGAIRRRLVQKMRAVGGAVTKSDEALLREAIALGFDDDVVVRRLLREEMRLLLRAGPPPDDATLRAWLAAHAEDFRQPATFDFTHVFLGEGGDAARALEALRAGRPPEDAGDPFPAGNVLAAQTRADVARRFGEDLAAAVDTLPVGVWSGPFASPFGLHLVRVDGRRPGRVPDLAEVRLRVAYASREAEADRRLRDALDRLRARHGVRVEWPSDAFAEVAP